MRAERYLFVAGLVVVAGLSACDSESEQTAETEQPVESESAPGGEEAEEHDDEEHAHEEEHGEEGHSHEVPLANKMYELSRRFSAIWFAGRAGNAEMVHYQIHEIEELVGGLEEASPTEHGVDVVERLENDVLAGLEPLEEKVAEGKTAAFQESYRAVMKKCATCHDDTEHGYIEPKIPEYNPYPNLEMKPPRGK